MKRFVLGFFFMLPILLSLSLTLDGRALASEDNYSKIQNEINSDYDYPKPEKMSERENYATSCVNNSSTSRTANTSVVISSDVVFSATTKVYNSNVEISPNHAITLGTNGKVIINGDLIIDNQGTFSMGTTCSLTVNGDIYVFGDLFVGGGNIAVNHSASGAVSGKLGGDIFFTGTLEMQSNARITVNKTSDDSGVYLLNYANMDINSANSVFLVNGVFMAEGTNVVPKNSSNSTLYAGSLIINGNFYQGLDYTFVPRPEFQVTINGASGSKSEVYFESPDNSFFDNVTFNNVDFTASSLISINRTLDKDYTINANNGRVQFQGDLKGYQLTVNARVFSTTYNEEVILNGGTIISNCDFFIGDQSSLVMKNAKDKVSVNGNFISLGGASFQNGHLDVNGDFYTTYSIDPPSTTFDVKIRGKNRFVYFENPDSYYFSNLEIANGTTFTSDSLLSLSTTLQSDLTLPCSVYFSGDLNNHSLATAGDLTIHKMKSLSINGGKLSVMGDMNNDGYLCMENQKDVVIVYGDFTDNESYANNDLTNGKLYLYHDFLQAGSPYSFCASGNHTTILCGAGAQTIKFNCATPKYESRFAHLVVTNDTLDLATLPSSDYYNDLIVACTSLKSFDTSAGSLQPDFSPVITNYLLFLPAKMDSVILTPKLPDSYIGSSWITVNDDITPVTEVDVNGIPSDGYKIINIIVHAVNDVDQKCYSVKIEQLNTNLASLGNLPDDVVVSPQFDPDKLNYTLDLPATQGDLIFAPQPENPDSKESILETNSPFTTVHLALGESVTYTICVTAQDLSASRNYSVIFTRHKPVNNITLSPDSIGFNAENSEYTVNTSANEELITVSPATDCSTIRINDTDVTNSPSYTVPTTGDVTIEALDSSGKVFTIYKIHFNRVVFLSGITLSKGALCPVFDPVKTDYSVYLPNATSSITITPVKTPSCTSITINGKAVSSVSLTPPSGGKSTATIICSNGVFSQTYTITVYRMMPVSAITVSSGSLSPAFKPGTMSYTVTVPSTSASVVVTAKTTDSCKSIITNGVPGTTSATVSPQMGGSATATFVITAQDNSVLTYTVTIKRLPLISGIKLSMGTLNQAFDPQHDTYTVIIPI